MMDILIPLFIQIIGAVIGGNIAGLLLKRFTLGFVGNALLGLHGGGLGGYFLGLVQVSIGGTYYGSAIEGVVGGCITAAALLLTLRVCKCATRIKKIWQPAVEC